MKTAIPILCLLFAAACVYAADKEKSADGGDASLIPTLVEVQDGVVRNNNQFAFELHQKLAAAHAGQNSTCSPASISNALGMLYMGAEGETANEMAAALHYRVPKDELGRLLNLASPQRDRPLYHLGVTVFNNKGNGVRVGKLEANGPAAKAGLKPGDVIVGIDNQPIDSEDDFRRAVDYSTGRIQVVSYDSQSRQKQTVTIAMDITNEPSPSQNSNQTFFKSANAMWVQAGMELKPAFVASLKTAFAAKAQDVDFAKTAEAVAGINSWVQKATDGGVEELVTTDDLDATTRLVLTNAISFKGLWSTEFDPKRTSVRDFVGLDGIVQQVPMMTASRSLNYGDAESFRVIELPYKDSTLAMMILLPKADKGLPELEKTISAGKFDALVASLKPSDVDLRIPKFKISTDLTLNEMLKDLGMKSALDPMKADFSGISSQQDLFLSKVVHEAHITVDEEGTTATAATGAVGVARGPFRVPFLVNHPFMFVLRDTVSNSVLFIGRVAKP